jgi:hypothetical protein
MGCTASEKIQAHTEENAKEITTRFESLHQLIKLSGTIKHENY